MYLEDQVLKLKIFPNPTAGRFVIDTKQVLKEIYIADFTRKIILRLAANGKTQRWNVNISAYPSGTYLVKYITAKNRIGTEKVVLIH